MGGRLPKGMVVDEGVVMNLYGKGFSAAEISEKLNVPERAVESAIKGNLELWESEWKKTAEWNLRWATEFYAIRQDIKKNIASKKKPRGRGARLYEYKGESLKLSQLSEKYGVSKNTLADRLRRGMSIAEAIEKPTRK